jgi:hypothetical protein
MANHVLAGLLLLIGAAACREPVAHELTDPASSVSARAPASVAALKTGPIRMETLEPNVVPPTFVMRGEPRGPARIVFFTGWATHRPFNSVLPRKEP